MTDCNAITVYQKQRKLVRRIYRWWVRMSEFDFKVKHRPGKSMAHVDALSRNPLELSDDEQWPNFVLRVQAVDWVKNSQATDQNIDSIQSILQRRSCCKEEEYIHANYELREDRVYQKTSRGLLRVVPRGMRHHIVRIAHEATNHGSVEKTIAKLNEAYWFEHMRRYMDRYVKSCIPCLYARQKGGKQEGFLHPIPKSKVPFETIHLDHLGPFPSSSRRNKHIIVIVAGFTKCVFLKAVRTRDTKLVIEFMRDFFCTYGVSKRIISDCGTAFTSQQFTNFCKQNAIQPIRVAVATPRANGQVEQLNRSVMDALLTMANKKNWDEPLRRVQFGINNMVNQSTGHTLSELLLGYRPGGGDNDAALRDAVQLTTTVIADIARTREEAAANTEQAQRKQKKHFDKKR